MSFVLDPGRHKGAWYCTTILIVEHYNKQSPNLNYIWFFIQNTVCYSTVPKFKLNI